jgi:hypothetical protein
MNLPPDIQFHQDLHLLIWKPRGLLNEKTINSILLFIGNEEMRSDANELRFTDTTGVTQIDLNFHYIFHVALYRRQTRKGRPWIKSAFLVQTAAFAHYFKLHVLLTDRSSIQARIFHEPETAARWLKVPARLLESA